jgi:hypothetical protein
MQAHSPLGFFQYPRGFLLLFFCLISFFLFFLFHSLIQFFFILFGFFNMFF